MIWENFQDKFHHSWHRKIRPFVESEECDKIYEFLKFEGKRGVQIAPLSSDTFKCFKETSFDELTAVVVGMCPYHTFRNGVPVADGLALSCSAHNYLQPPLEQFYKAIEVEYYKGICAGCIKNPDLSYLANQGVLLLNAGLTVEANKPGSHNSIWEPFMKYLFQEVLDVVRVPVIFLGKESTKLEKYVDPFTWQFKISHPASAAYKGTEWNSEGVFVKVNKILMALNGTEIEWMDGGGQGQKKHIVKTVEDEEEEIEHDDLEDFDEEEDENF
jgi:uracil-DNA glycosylase